MLVTALVQLCQSGGIQETSLPHLSRWFNRWLLSFLEEFSVRSKQWWLSTRGIVMLAFGLSVLMLAETMFAPWGPYFPLFAVLSTGIPLFLKSYRFGNLRKVMASAWLLTLGVFALDLVVDLGISNWLYQRVLVNAGLGSDPFHSVDAAMELMSNAVTQELGITLDTAEGLFALFALVWAPFGEELFYRGYLFGTLRKHHSFWKAALVPAIFFGVRHGFHFFYLWPEVPLAAAGVWTISTTAYAIYISYLYEKTNSLYSPIIEHILINIVWLFATL